MSKPTSLRLWSIFILIGAILLAAIFLYNPESDPTPEATEENVQTPAAKLSSNESAPSVREALGPVREQGSTAVKSPSEVTHLPLSPTVKAPISKRSPEENMPSGPFAESPALKAQETIKIDPPMVEIGKAWLEGRAQNDFTMPVAGGRDLEIEVERFESIGEEGGAFIGRVKGKPDSSVHLSYRGPAEAGTIRLPSENKVYRIFPGQSGALVVQERDLALEEANYSATPFNLEIPPVPNFTPPPPPADFIDKVPQ